jgi:hypothetical protein
VQEGARHGGACRCYGPWVGEVNLSERLLGFSLRLLNCGEIEVRGKIGRLCKHQHAVRPNLHEAADDGEELYAPILGGDATLARVL